LQIGEFKITEWVFTFPAMEPGAILEYRYDRHDNFLFFIDPFYFEGPEYTLRAKVTQIFPADMGYMALADLCDVQPQVSDWRMGKEKGKLYSLELKDLPGYRDEIFMPPAREVSPRLELVLQSWKGVYWIELDRRDILFGDWISVAKLMDDHYQKVIKEGQAVLKPLVEGWVQGLSEPQEKAKAIARRVQEEFRYIPWTSVVGGSRKIETLITEKTADNEEKAVLLSAALKVVGIESQLAAVSGKHVGSLNPKFFSPSQFTHVVVGIPQEGGSPRWIDPTVSYAPFGFVPWRDAGATAMILKDGLGEILDLPQKNEVSAARYRSSVKPRPDGKADVAIEAEFIGEEAVELRDDLLPAAETARLAYLQAWLARRRPGSALKSHAIENLQDVEKPLRLKLAIEAPGLVTVADETTLVRGCVLTCEDSNPLSRRARRHPFYVDRGWNEEEIVMIQPGTAMQVETPPPVSARSEVASLTFSCLAQGDGARCTRQFTARRNRWPATVQENLRRMYDKVVEADRSTVALQPASPETAAGGR
ncbi:MAG: transglutaminase domain-containing protein, partial [Candidatus Polarisedimenticolia bacterium]